MIVEERLSATHVTWGDIPVEELNASIGRRFVSTEQLMIGQVFLKKGTHVAAHSHVNEQITFIVSGAMQFWIGANDEQTFTLRPGELVVIPSNVLHRAYALEDTLDTDIFNPPRRDWIDGTDAYLRQDSTLRDHP